MKAPAADEKRNSSAGVSRRFPSAEDDSRQQEGSSAGRCKHIDIRFRFAAEAIKDRVVRVRYPPTDLNLADMLTKPLVTKEFGRLVDMCRDRKSTKFAVGDKELSVATGQQAFMVHCW